MDEKTPRTFKRIGIIGGGFSGTALAAALHRFSNEPIEIILFDKSKTFGEGEAYRTTYPYHLLNVRANNMSAFADLPNHFLDWLKKNPQAKEHLNDQIPYSEQFAPRFLYAEYLKFLINEIQMSNKTHLKLESIAVTDLHPMENEVKLLLSDKRRMTVDKLVFAIGNGAPAALPFTMDESIQYIANPWDYTAATKIDKQSSVLIVGTGLSMIDTVLTLYHQKHQGKIYAVSRHGLIPLPHTEYAVSLPASEQPLPNKLRELAKLLRFKGHYQMKAGGDWRTVINEFRPHAPSFWLNASLADKQRFLRHVLPYWNIHRHRVNPELSQLLEQLKMNQQFQILAGRVQHVQNGKAKIQLRHSQEVKEINMDWIVNCIGPALSIRSLPLIKILLQRKTIALDPLQLGFYTNMHGAISTEKGESKLLYALGPPTKGMFWECGAVPEIRKQSFELVKHLLDI